MQNAVVYSSVTGNTRKLAEAIKDKVGAEYFGEPCDEALEAEMIFVGFWTTKNSCGPDVKEFLAKLSNKKLFLFGTAGYNNTKEYFDGILDSVKAIVPESNTIVGSYMCQGKVSDAMQEKIKQGRPELLETNKEQIKESVNHPDETDINGLLEELEEVK